MFFIYFKKLLILFSIVFVTSVGFASPPPTSWLTADTQINYTSHRNSDLTLNSQGYPHTVSVKFDGNWDIIYRFWD